MPTLQPGKLKPEKTAKSMWLEKAGWATAGGGEGGATMHHLPQACHPAA
jgi:hypothetical protein